MRITDIVTQLRVVFPQFSDALSDILLTDSVVASGGLVTVTTSTPHGLTTGDPVVLQKFSRRTPIQTVIPTSDAGLTYLIKTAQGHDLTEGWHESVSLDGFTDPEWNSEFDLASVISGDTFGIADVLPVPALTGNEVLLENLSNGVNGYYAVTVTGTNTFTVDSSAKDGNYSDGEISASIRIAGTVDIARAIEQYTKQGLEAVWAFVVPNDVDISKDMHTSSDATATIMSGSDEFRLRAIDGFTLYLIKSTKQDIGGVEAVDLFRHDLLLPILRSICGVKFPVNLTTGPDFRTVLRGHGVAQYSRAFLVYAYDFEQPYDIVNTDTAYDDDTVAFRQIHYIHRVGGDDTEDAEANIILDYDDE